MDDALVAILQAGAAAHERFLNESREMDRAWADGKLEKWLKAKLEAEKRGFANGNGSDAGNGEPPVA